MELFNISWYAEAFRVHFTGTKGPSPAPEEQPHTIIPLHQTLHLAQCSQTNTVLLATTKPRLVHQIARWRSAICHSREGVSTAQESSGGVLYTTASHALHCICWLGCSCLAMETHSMKLSMYCSWAKLKAIWGLKFCSDWLCRKLATSMHYAPHHLLTLLHHFTWPTTSWLSFCRSHSLPLCYNITDSRLWNI